MKYLFILSFIVVFALFGLELGYADGSPFYTHFTYMFQHAGLVHLIINSIAFIGMFHSMRRFAGKWYIVVSMLSCGFAASFLSAHEIPTVGASAIIYAMIGMYIGITSFSPRVKIADPRKYLLFITCVVMGLLVSLLRQNSNFLVHLWSLILGLFASLTKIVGPRGGSA